MSANGYRTRHRRVIALLWLWIGIASIAYLHQFRNLIARLFTLLFAA